MAKSEWMNAIVCVFQFGEPNQSLLLEKEAEAMMIRKNEIQNGIRNIKKLKKGFTLIELMTVISIMGILTSMAAPQFLRQADYAKEVDIRNNVLLVESGVRETLILNKELFEGWPVVEMNILEQSKTDEMLFDRDGLVEPADVLVTKTYRKIPEVFVKEDAFSALTGTFYTDQDGVIYYENQ